MIFGQSCSPIHDFRGCCRGVCGLYVSSVLRSEHIRQHLHLYTDHGAMLDDGPMVQLVEHVLMGQSNCVERWWIMQGSEGEAGQKGACRSCVCYFGRAVPQYMTVACVRMLPGRL